VTLDATARIACLLLYPWRRLEMEEHAYARRLMSAGVLRLAYVPYAPGEHRLEATGVDVPRHLSHEAGL
jgi:hypothetical protein